MTPPPPARALRQAATAAPDGLAIALDRGAQLSFAAWDERSNAIAAGLSSALPGGARVALLFDGAGWLDYAVACMAVWKAGMVPVPLLAGIGDFELGRLLHHCQPAALIAASELAPSHPEVPLLELGALSRGSGRAAPEAQAGPAGPASPASEPDELLYRALPLTKPLACERRLGDLPHPPPPLLHAFPPGSLAGQEALRGCLTVTDTGSLVLDRFDAERMAGLIAETPERACGLDEATVQALIACGATRRHDVSGLRSLHLATTTISPSLRAALGTAFARAEVRVMAALPPRRRPEPASVGACEISPVAPSQEGMLWQEVFAPGCQNLPGLARRYDGPLDLAALRHALDEIVRRHAALRTNFEVRDGQAVQVTRLHQPLDLPVRDLSPLPAVDREQAVAEIVAEAGRRPFHLAEEPLFAPTLLRLAAEEHVLVIRTHHTVFDDWSVGVFRRQLGRLYDDFSAHGAPSLPEPALQFANFARQQQAALAGATGAREREFWRRELHGAPLCTQLPVHDPGLPAGAPQSAGQTVTVPLGDRLHARIEALAQRERATVFMILLAAFGIVVRRYTGQDDLVLATVVAHRNRSELERMIGCFTKKVPVRLRLHGDPTFPELLARTRQALLGALGHQDLPFEAVIQDVLGPAAAAHGLVPQVAVMFQGVTPPQPLVLEGVSSVGLQTAARAGRAHFAAAPGEPGRTSPPARPAPPLPWGGGLYAGTFTIVSVDESDPELPCSARGAFDPAAVRSLLQDFAAVLEAIVHDPRRPLSALGTGNRPAAAGTVDLGGFGVVPARIEAALSASAEVGETRVELEPGAGGSPELVARCPRPAPAVSRLRAAVWTRLPGYATPARVVSTGPPDEYPLPEPDESPLPEQSVLEALWTGAPDAETASAPANYWQAFSFLEALALAREAGLPVPGPAVMRNRTVENLAAALAAGGYDRDG